MNKIIFYFEFFHVELFFNKFSFSLFDFFHCCLFEINSENFPKKISAIFFAVISINREPTCAIFPPTFASTL